LTDLASDTDTPAPIAEEGGWASKPVWTWWWREKSLPLSEIEPQPDFLVNDFSEHPLKWNRSEYKAIKWIYI